MFIFNGRLYGTANLAARCWINPYGGLDWHTFGVCWPFC
jgi:hypothetical protein